jgi:hypothetical protein
MASESTSNWSLPVASILSLLAGAGLAAYALNRPPGQVSTAPSMALALLRDTISYIPHILLLFGVLADMLTYEGVYSFPSLFGLLSIFIDKLFSYFWSGVSELATTVKNVASQNPRSAVPTLASNVQAGGAGVGDFFKNYDGCNVQGFGKLASPYSIQTLVVTSTVFSYYIFDLIRNRGWTNSAATLVIAIVFTVAQIFVVGDCPIPEGGVDIGKTGRVLASLVEGLFVGGLSYGIMQTYYPSSVPSATISPFPRKTASDLKKGPDGKYTDAEGNPYVVLPNGQAVPDLSTADSRKAFANIASMNLGTGAIATDESCSSA